MATVLITGGTGMIGTELCHLLLKKEYEVIVLTRKPAEVKNKIPGVQYAECDVNSHTIDKHAVAKADHIIHLAGAGVADGRWTEKRKQEIIDSRTKSSTLLVNTLKEIPNHVSTVVSASAIGWYGPDTKESKQNGFKETAPADNDFLGRTCRLWEASIEPVEQLSKRLVKLRTGIVLSKTGGALNEFKKPLKAFTAAILGDGKQMVSWIHVEDLCSLYIYAIENTSMDGSYNAVAPAPVNNKELTLALARQMHGNTFITIHVPVFALKIALGEMSVEVLKSTTVSAKKTEAAGFSFCFPTVEKALADLIQK